MLLVLNLITGLQWDMQSLVGLAQLTDKTIRKLGLCDLEALHYLLDSTIAIFSLFENYPRTTAWPNFGV